MWIFILWIFFCFVAGKIAANKGRSGFGFFLLAFLLSPLVGIICAALASPDKRALDRRAVENHEKKRCPHCGELIARQATICRFCSRDFPRLES
jgi:ribosomal protein S14